MVAALASKWWVFLAQGIIMILLALVAFTQPTILITLIGAYAIVEGVLKLFSGIGDQPDGQSRWPALLIGALSIIVGVWLLANRLVALEALAYLIAAWAIVIGVLLIVWAIRLREEISDEWLMIVFGVLSIIFGFLVFNNVIAGILSLAWIFAIYMIAGGILAIVLGFRIKGLGERLSMAG
ncbi:MAG: HdeD family acid-resistance protein [Thermomicrobiales bacterium]